MSQRQQGKTPDTYRDNWSRGFIFTNQSFCFRIDQLVIFGFADLRRASVHRCGRRIDFFQGGAKSGFFQGWPKDFFQGCGAKVVKFHFIISKLLLES